ncbi:hypothetical protein J3R30DRAFT_3486679 [Lentinula aciculospora]|uniref:Uncharacterized protein n=1 Tax=Lentinula aciculospora TaxID=153920 RepID=A0A9W9A995_9AGAR|nr:hypothetical protein J3R30DRAFT_3486679 [Lentinula aciculospora]
MTADVLLDKATFISLWIESILYGCHVAIFLSSLYLLRYRKPTLKFSRTVTAVMLTTMFALSTTHMSINFARGLKAFVSYQETPFGASVYLRQLWASINVAKQAVYVINVLVGDSFALYRSYIILGETHFECDQRFRKLIVFPMCSLISSAACGYKSVYNLSQLSNLGENAFSRGIFDFRAALLGLSLVTNTFATLLIVVFIALKSKNNMKATKGVANPYRKAYFSLLQFGIIIPSSLTTSLVLYSLKMNANLIVLDAMSQITGFASAIVVINNHLPGLFCANQLHQLGAKPSIERIHQDFLEKNRSRGRAHSESSMTPLTVRIDRVVEPDTDTR